MGDISEHFSRSEMRCRCGCGGDTMDYATIQILERIRFHFQSPVHINSAYRCLDYNRSIGSNDTSQHPKGRAVDITVDGVEPEKVAEYADEIMPQSGGIGKYDTFTHIDTRSDGFARWRG